MDMEVQKKINNWEEFEKRIKDVYSDYQERKAETGLYVSTPLFRGQSNGEWDLETTLDRWRKDISVEEYFRIIIGIKSTIESCLLKRWELSYSDIGKAIEELGRSLYRIPVPFCEYMAHLRHNGFPSPLLDWTRSPYIAAFFAFNEDKKTDPAIFIYTEFAGEGKAGNSRKAEIHSIGPNLTTHRRHHLQQCEYTYCVKRNNGKIYYTNHEDVFSQDRDNNQDLLEKYTLSYSERSNFIKNLNLMNINAYSLFETEEALMGKLANEEFLIGD